ncbi:MAG: spermidine synthase, partial [Planctomycetaceae bacterium]
PQRAAAPVAPQPDRQPAPRPVIPAGKRRRERRAALRREVSAPAEPPALGTSATTALAFLSGFGALALQVLWTRMLSQVLENSVYTFAAILVIVLVCLAAGAAASTRLARLAVPPAAVLVGVLVAGGLAVAVTPFTFAWLTDSMRIVTSAGSWPAYVAVVFRTGFLAIGVPATLLGIVFPFLLEVEARLGTPPASSLGRLSAVNTAGAIVGALAGGFVMLGTFGMWRSMQVVAVLFLAAGLAVALRAGRLRVAAGLALGLAVGLLDPARLPVTSTDPDALPRQIVETREGSDCTVSVARDPFGLALVINSHYGLGSTGARMQEQLQADIPLLVFPRTRSVFFLGLGTGITAGSALDRRHPAVSRVVACELVPEVVAAARKYMTNVDGIDVTGGLFTDPRATVLVADGRHHLAAARDRYDMINADLFVPYRSGAGSLYAREHFATAKARLEPGGVFVQWLPLYQLTETEFAIIARTMLDVFDRVSLWRSTFQPGEDVVALAGHVGDAPLPAADGDGTAARRQAIAGMDHRDLDRLLLPFDPGTMPFFYCGNLSAARDLFAAAQLNTDDMPLIEYLAPRTYRRSPGGPGPWFVGPRLADLVDTVLARCPPDRDPLLANRSAAERLLPLAGAAFHRARLAQAIGDEAACREAWKRFTAAWAPPETPTAP